jgi:sugar phosphate isomerase/epimerase
MKLSFSTLGCPDWTIEQIAAKAREYGYDGVELRVHADGKHLSPADAPDRAGRAGALFREAGVEIAALSAYAEYGSAEPAKAAENAGLTRALIRMASAAGAGMVRVYGGAGGKDETLDRVADRVVCALRPLAAEAREAGVRLAIETHTDPGVRARHWTFQGFATGACAAICREAPVVPGGGSSCSRPRRS